MLLITALIHIYNNRLGGGVTTGDRDAHRPRIQPERCAAKPLVHGGGKVAKYRPVLIGHTALIN